jgi:hypothetical protein
MNQRLLLESKEHMRARGVRSPDEWDAVALTFAEPVKDVPRREGNRAPLHRFEYDPFSYKQEGEQEWRYSSADRADIAYHTERLRRRALGLPE